MSNMFEFLQLQPALTVDDAPLPVPEHIEEVSLEDVTFRYPDMDRDVLSHYNLRARAGEVTLLEGENGSVVMIPFKGSVKSELFNGIVEPCGVDTQIRNAAMVRHMSARYMLTGTDCEGKEAHIYIENNGWFDERGGHMTMPFHTVPTFYTDSKALAPYLHRNQFEGEGHMLEDGLHILFFEIEH